MTPASFRVLLHINWWIWRIAEGCGKAAGFVSNGAFN